MRVLLQRVKHANVSIEDRIVGEIGSGYVLLVGFTHEDTEIDIVKMARKIAQLRVFTDENGKMNEALEKHGNAVLSISQFTLYGDTRDGNRPSFTKAAKPDLAYPLYERFNEQLRIVHGIDVHTGVFGADMLVHIENDGPVTIWFDTHE
jgi:D-tyrosyl-tRNA(Tyr) deacylase